MLPVALALAAFVSVAPRSSPEVPALVEVATTRFAPNLEGISQFAPALAAHPDRPFAYAWSHEYLFVFDTVAGEVAATRPLSDVYGDRPSGSGQMLPAAGGSSAWLVLGPINGHDAIEVYSLDDPREPTHARSIPAVGFKAFHVLPGGRWLVVVARRTASIHDLGTGDVLGTFEVPGGPYVDIERLIASGGSEAAATVALVENRWDGQRHRYFLDLHDVSAEGLPTLRASTELPKGPELALIDRDAEIVVLGYSGARYEIRDARSATLLSEVVAGGGGRVATLAQGRGTRVLAVADPDGVDLFDLADPILPVVRGRVITRLGFEFNDSMNALALAPSRSAPLLFAASPGDAAILAIDVRDGTIAGRSPTAGLPAVAIALGEGGGRRDAVALAFRAEFLKVLAPGGRREIQVHDLADIATPALVSRIHRSEPWQVGGLVAVGPDHAVAVEPANDAYALVSLREGRVTQVTGPPRYVGGSERLSGDAWLRSAGRFLLAVGSGGWQEWAFIAGRLEPIAGGGDPVTGGYTVGEVHRDGRVVLIGYDPGGWFLEVRDLDGRTGRLRMNLTENDDLALSPDARRATIARFGFEPGEGFLTCVDLLDPEQPVVAWTGVPDVATVRFDSTGAEILVTQGYFSTTFTASRVDARTGAAVAGPGAPIGKYFYHGDATAFGSGAGWRAVYWRWSYIGFVTVLLDAGAPTPSVLRVYPEILEGFPLYAPRATGGWYEIVRNPWNAFADFFVAAADGEQRHVLRDARDHEYPVSLQHGYFATVAHRHGLNPEVILWLDTTLSRPPRRVFSP